MVKNPHGNLSVIFEGISRAKISSVEMESGYLMATYSAKEEKQSFKPSTSHIL